MGETPLVNCGPRSYSLHSIQSICFTVFFANIFHSIRLILCYSKPVRLTTSLFRWDKVLGLCCAGSALAPESLVLRRITFRDHQPSTCFLAPPGSIKPWFLSEGKLATVRIIPSSCGSQRTCTSTRITQWPPSGPSRVLWKLPVKIGYWALISSDSENISLLGFLKPKTAENRNWRFGIS